MEVKITAHCLIKNEDRWIWFALKSVLPFVDKILVYDTGSTDETVNIVQKINDKKIFFREVGECTKEKLTQLRQKMLGETKSDWFLILDGDEIWPRESIIKTIKAAIGSPENIVAIVNPVRNCIGDVFHYLPESSGNYQIADKKGNLNIRLIKKKQRMRIKGEYPLEVYEDENGKIQNQNENLLFADSWYLHTSFLKRSSKDLGKVSGSFGKRRIWQQGIKMDTSELPEVFFEKYPEQISDPLKKRSFIYEAGSVIFKPLISAKRKMA